VINILEGAILVGLKEEQYQQSEEQAQSPFGVFEE